MATVFPAGLVPQSILFDLENVSRSGGVSTNGMEQIVGSGVGRWKATLSSIPIRRKAEVLTWRAFRAGLRGRAGTVLVPVFDGKRVNWPEDPYGRVLHPGRTRRPQLDGTAYEDPEVPEASMVRATCLASAALRAVVMQIGIDVGSPILVGQYFSPAPGRLHMIVEVINGTTFRIEPPLREACQVGQAIDFVRPTCLMRLASDDSGSLELELARTGTVSPEFVETI